MASPRALVATSSPIHGLPRRQLPLMPVFAQSVAAVAPSGAAAVIPALVLASVGGGGAIAAFAAAAVVVLLVSACLRPMAQRMSAVGGIYSYTARGLGPLVAVPTGWSAIIGYGAVGMAGLIAVGTYLCNIMVSLGVTSGIPTAAIIAVLIGASVIATAIMVRGIRVSAWITLLIECISIALLAVLFVLVLVTTLRHGTPVRAAMTWTSGTQNLAVGVVVAVSAFVGFESSTTLSGEARQPFRSVPLTIRWTPVIAGVLYMASVTVLAIALHGAPSSVQHSSTPFVALLAAQHATALSAILDLGIAASFFACTVASINALVRVLFCMGREGVAPSVLGRTHPRFKTPAPAIIASMVVVTTAPIVVLVAGTKPHDGLLIFLTLSACGYLGTYLSGCIAAPILLRRIGESTLGGAVLSALTTTILLVLFGNAIYFAWRDGAVLLSVYGALLAVSVLYTIGLRFLAPQRLSAVGIYDETQRGDLLDSVPFR
ncbi:APC family permease [Mycolicibacterium fluoranthenivorans]|uniref:Amino acid transporter n=1 Tax=Mycolicibacterium fluoranthenivorans TaxID=258505 RepID=A0A7X5ZBG8_9MYCO|nr:APC family permease [Mycolicibacterium fluoranthenivorans]MCV7356837.1 APC family permease [Mycolicibacterium fluoranthenivorans]NIH94229.1 amino acid transporter [Mycolicibacterium fluoranthenivorans]